MAKALVTREAVFEAADALAAAGDEPSMLIVQERIGAGSYTTIKRYLDIWKTERKTAAPAIEVPPDLTTRGQAFIQTVWASAATISEQRVAEVRATAEQQVRQATAALTAAEATIAHLEADADQATRELADLHRQLAEARASGDAAHTAARVAEARSTEQEQQIADLRQQVVHQQGALETARTVVADHARLSGERTAVRQQLHDQAALIERLTTRDR